MSIPLARKRLAIIGAGKIGGILIQAFLRRKIVPRGNLRVTVRHPERARAIAERLKVRAGTDNRAAVRGADIILLAVKPTQVREVLEEIRAQITSKQMIVSVAASVPTTYLEEHLPPGVPVVRAMPNTPCAVGAGMTGISKGKHASPAHVAMAQELFEAVGRTVVVDEKHMDAVTGLSASGPAFLWIVLEALTDGGVKTGLPRDVATLLAAQTMNGAARMVLDTGDHPAMLKDGVTTPAGCTIDGILELEDGKVRIALIKAVARATQRAKELLFEG
ncbi:MAG TPA: pyrroline-5-carboxylate reductase [Candidatus Acidoferrales bacterium]|nr:pyrroline-5-carboxylate reductase [Candidatus Acidoferrales bacterium]